MAVSALLNTLPGVLLVSVSPNKVILFPAVGLARLPSEAGEPKSVCEHSGCLTGLSDCLTGTGGRTSSQDAQGSALTSKKGFCPLLSPRIALNQVNHPSRELASPIYFSLCLDQLSKINHVHTE